MHVSFSNDFLEQWHFHRNQGTIYYMPENDAKTWFDHSA